MPFDSNGVFSLTPGYLAVTGETIQPTQHNPPLEDIAAQGLSEVLVRDGRAPMTGALNMNGFKAIGLLAGTAGTDAVNKTQLDAVSSLITGAQARVVTKTANYTALDADYAASIQFTTAATLSFDTTANLRTNWRIEVWNNSAGLVPIDPASTDTINGTATLVLQPGQWAEVIKTGATTFRAIVFGDPLSGPQIQGYASGLALTTNATDPANDVDFAAGVAASDTSPYYLMQFSALTKRLDATFAAGNNGGMLDTGVVGNGNYYLFGIGRSDTGATDYLGSLSSTAPLMPTNYDRKRLLGFVVRASATNEAPIGNLGPIKHSPRLLLNTLTSAEFDFPAGVKRGRIVWNALSTNGAIVPQVQLGTASSFVTAGYTGGASTVSNAAASVSAVAGVPIAAAFGVATSTQGHVEFVIGPNNVWTITSLSGFDNVAATALAGASVPLGAPLTRGRINLSSTAFDAGYAYAMWEF